MLKDYLQSFSNREYVNYTNKHIITFQENESIYRANNHNNKYVYEIYIDKGILRNISRKKCDNGIFIENDETLILIELKGCDIEQAFKQIIETYKWFYNIDKTTNIKLLVRIVIKHKNKSINLEYNKKKLLKICKWSISISDIIVKELIVDNI